MNEGVGAVERAFMKRIKLDFPRFMGKNPLAWIYMAH